jgi:hypothetical protein
VSYIDGNFHVSRIPETWKSAKSYFFRPRPRQSFSRNCAFSFYASSDLSMILRNLRLVLRARVSSSALRRGITAAKGFPLIHDHRGFSCLCGIFRKRSWRIFELDFCHSFITSSLISFFYSNRHHLFLVLLKKTDKQFFNHLYASLGSTARDSKSSERRRSGPMISQAIGSLRPVPRNRLRP